VSERVDWEALSDVDFERFLKRLVLVELLLEESVSPQERRRLRAQFCSEQGVSDRTITNWIARYQAGGPAALTFHPPRGPRGERIGDAELRAKLLELVHELPLRSVAKLRRLIANTPVLAERVARISDRTIYRFLHERGLSWKARQSMADDEGGGRAYHHFEAPHSLALVQGDARDGIWLHLADGSVRKTYLFLWVDDFSRKLLFGKYYLDEKLPCLEDTFKHMVLRWGIPISAFMDNGSVFVSRQFTSVLAELQVRGRHHKAFASWAKGKIVMRTHRVLSPFSQCRQDAASSCAHVPQAGSRPWRAGCRVP
jgi:transposase